MRTGCRNRGAKRLRMEAQGIVDEEVAHGALVHILLGERRQRGLLVPAAIGALEIRELHDGDLRFRIALGRELRVAQIERRGAIGTARRTRARGAERGDLCLQRIHALDQLALRFAHLGELQEDLLFPLIFLLGLLASRGSHASGNQQRSNEQQEALLEMVSHSGVPH